LTDFDPGLRLIEKTGGLYFEIKSDGMWMREPHKIVASMLLGKAVIPNLPYEQPDGSPIRIDTDYLGESRNEANPTPGPFERSSRNDLTLKVW
jgi:alpha-N-arabinofuranosidase